MLHELNIEYKEKYNFYVVSCPAGCRITNWTDDKDIRDFNDAVEMYVPGSMTEDEIRNTYHCISDEDHEKYTAMVDEAIKADHPDPADNIHDNGQTA